MKNKGIKVECLECGRKFSTKSMLPTCPKCKGSDIDLARAIASPLGLRIATPLGLRFDS
jgi:Zn finger protein HypA/HybF involved in hydrogenase expression